MTFGPRIAPRRFDEVVCPVVRTIPRGPEPTPSTTSPPTEERPLSHRVLVRTSWGSVQKISLSVSDPTPLPQPQVGSVPDLLLPQVRGSSPGPPHRRPPQVLERRGDVEKERLPSSRTGNWVDTEDLYVNLDDWRGQGLRVPGRSVS